MICCFQLIDKNDGTRSPPMTCNREEFAQELKKLGEESISKTLVIALAEKIDNEWRLCEAPVFTAESFIYHFSGVNGNEREKVHTTG